jgi:hypothetical protein
MTLAPGCVGSCRTGDDTVLPNSADGDGPSDNELSPEAPTLTLLPLLLLLFWRQRYKSFFFVADKDASREY